MRRSRSIVELGVLVGAMARASESCLHDRRPERFRVRCVIHGPLPLSEQQYRPATAV